MILLTGASGYVGGRLLPLLEQAGNQVRCLVRRPASLARIAEPNPVAPSGSHGSAEVVVGDLLDPASLDRALSGVVTAFYLVHSMNAAGSFEQADRVAARNFGAAARRAGVRRIIYLGGLGYENGALSPHLRSRQEVGEILRSSGVPVTEFRASIVIGPGSLSFEMIRALVERLPVMIAPRWVAVPAQPIAISDLLGYLLAAMDQPLTGGRIYEIGGADQVSYGDLLREYARQRGLRRLILSVPVLTPRLSSLWLALVTPLYARVGRRLIDSMRHPTVVRDGSALTDFAIRPLDVAQAVAAALVDEDHAFENVCWSSALASPGARRRWYGVRMGSRIVDSRVVQTGVPAHDTFDPVRRIGGRVGWYHADWLWLLRGAIDRLIGGPGLRRGRRDPERLEAGDRVDCWRVERFEPDRRLRLVAELKLPGRAWLEFTVEDGPRGASLRQTAVFDSAGVLGRAYWYAVYPLHELVFSGMQRGIAAAGRRAARERLG